jgi:RNA polymerase sigma-70 factor (ECF subfamily)
MSGDPASPGDGALVAAALAGDRGAFGALMERHQQAIFGYLYRLVFRDVETAQDLTQTVFLKAYQGLAGVDRARPFTPWLYRIAHNEAANWLRARQRHPEAGLDDPEWGQIADTAGPSPEAARAGEEERSLVRQGLERLKPRTREVMQLFFFEDRPYEEIAAILNLPVGTVGTLIRRGKQDLQAWLEVRLGRQGRAPDE